MGVEFFKRVLKFAPFAPDTPGNSLRRPFVSAVWFVWKWNEAQILCNLVHILSPGPDGSES